MFLQMFARTKGQVLMGLINKVGLGCPEDGQTLSAKKIQRQPSEIVWLFFRLEWGWEYWMARI